VTAATDKIAASAAPVVVRVELGERGYDVLIGSGLIDQAGSRIARLRPGASAAIVTDEMVARLYLERLERALSAAGMSATKIVVPPGESSKSYAMLERVVDAILAARIERGDLVIALGGGVIGDLAGFAAAIARRGIDLVQIPTTLLAQVDSAVGGKTGINSRHGKNLVGAFHQPVLVLADPALLDSLPPREFRAGYAEIAKYGLIGDAAFFGWLEQNWRQVFSGGDARLQAVATSCRAKAAIVGRDERESGERAVLNLGHTFGHALEAATGFSDRLLHGEAIAIGIVLAFRLSARLRLTDPSEEARVAAHLAAVGLPTRLKEIPGKLPDAAALLSLMAQDKKVRQGALVFVLVRGIGKAFVQPDVEPAVVREFLNDAFRDA
jgi:3-dehydroquinate synthase